MFHIFSNAWTLKGTDPIFSFCVFKFGMHLKMCFCQEDQNWKSQIRKKTYVSEEFLQRSRWCRRPLRVCCEQLAGRCKWWRVSSLSAGTLWSARSWSVSVEEVSYRQSLSRREVRGKKMNLRTLPLLIQKLNLSVFCCQKLKEFVVVCIKWWDDFLKFVGIEYLQDLCLWKSEQSQK